MIELLLLGAVVAVFCPSPAELAVRQRLMSDVQKRMFSKMTDESRVRPMFKNRCWSQLAPPCDHPPKLHIAPVERSLCRVLVIRSGVGIPKLHRRVHIKHAVVVAPLHDF